MWPSTHLSLLQGVHDQADQDAWSRFADSYRDGIVKICCRELGMKSEAAEEAAQEVLLKLLSTMQQFRYDAGGSFRGWLATVARRTAIDLLRSEGRRLDLATGRSSVADIVNGLPDPAERLGATLQTELRQDLLAVAEVEVKKRLKEPTTWSVYLAYKRGEEAPAIAETHGMEVSTVYKAKSRIIQMLQREISRLTSVL